MSAPRLDYHIHTSLCNHATGSMDEYVEAACRAGLTEMAFTDHIPMAHPVLEPFCMPRRELDGYAKKVLELRDRYRGRIEIKLGLEADYVEGTQDHVKEILNQYPFDLVLGSVHVMDDWGIDHEDYLDRYVTGNLEEIFYTYFQHLERAANSGMFDIMAHPDLVKKFNYFPPLEDWSDLYMDALNAIASMGVAIEINSGGLHKPVNEVYPSPGFLQHALARGVKLVTGSDAHAPSEVGRDFDRIYAGLQEAGVHELLTFTERKRAVFNLEN